ncbi:uncharacterized protein LOC126353443 [Schistocerca gregaria]|uniref:uncharacterized protein LOC126353443 n=1 Tax=Schistocerca gregaria TaxID=7010 RepID=UPI00211E699D|nr:uncharacterized protein LOC126353443 [Schistocerca gregaria]
MDQKLESISEDINKANRQLNSVNEKVNNVESEVNSLKNFAVTELQLVNKYVDVINKRVKRTENIVIDQINRRKSELHNMQTYTGTKNNFIDEKLKLNSILVSEPISSLNSKVNEVSNNLQTVNSKVVNLETNMFNSIYNGNNMFQNNRNNIIMKIFLGGFKLHPVD